MASRGYPITRQMKEERHKRAQALLDEYDKNHPTPKDKLKALPPTGSTKQRKRLENLVTKEQVKENKDS